MTDLFTTASAFRSLAATLADGPTADHASARCVGCRLPFLAEDLDAHGQCDSCCPEAMVYCENLDCELDVPSADLVPGGCVHCCCPDALVADAELSADETFTVVCDARRDAWMGHVDAAEIPGEWRAPVTVRVAS